MTNTIAPLVTHSGSGSLVRPDALDGFVRAYSDGDNHKPGIYAVRRMNRGTLWERVRESAK